MQIAELTPIIGAEIRGIDPARITPEEGETVRAALADRAVRVFRDQNRDREAHQRVARLFGTGMRW